MSDTSNKDELLAELLEGLIEQSTDGRAPDIESVVAQHPDLETELRELWATAMIAEDFVSFSGELDELTAGVAAAPKVPATIPAQIGEYIPDAEIGRGGMGVVYRAHQSSLGRTVALKMLLRGDLASAADVARFRAEAESAARLSHPHLVPVYEVGEHDGRPFFSMQLVEGTTLAKRLADGPLPPRDAAELLAPVCRGIAHAHQQGVLHRDLKPSNVLIDEEGRPFVTDFGLAKRVRSKTHDESGDGEKLTASLTQDGAILGTPSYMAPEQAAGHRGEIGPATDVYSLGAILYAMLTGRPPFQAASPVDTVLMVLEQEPVPPRILNPKADSDLEMIALKCLQKPTDLRYSDADALADDLDAFLAHEPITARSSHFTQIISRAFRETHHAGVLENWGVLWMWHSLVLLILCLITNSFQLADIENRWPYIGLWVIGLGLWAAYFWSVRRRGGPITFVERQIVHLWAGSMIASTLLYFVEWYLDLRVLELAPVLGLISGMVFLVKAGILTGAFYIQAVALFLTGAMMAVVPTHSPIDFSITLFGVVSAVCFFTPGLKYYRQRRSS